MTHLSMLGAEMKKAERGTELGRSRRQRVQTDRSPQGRLCSATMRGFKLAFAISARTGVIGAELSLED